MEHTTITQEMLRNALQGFCKEGEEVSLAQLCAAFDLHTEPEKARIRRRISDMVAHGEISRVRDGVYEYNFSHRPRSPKSFSIIWRFIRKAKPGWSIAEASMLTRISYTQISRYCSWLEEEGHITRAGKNGTTTLYRATAKANASPETPYPPLRDVDPFAKERAAAASIARLMLCADPYSAKTARNLVAACQLLLARFGKIGSQNENGNENSTQKKNTNKGEDHVE